MAAESRHLICDSQSEADTATLGRRLAAALPDPAVVALSGPLGAGKTRLVQAVAAALGVDRRTVVSPTFVLVQEYRGRRPIYHFDAYRVSGEREFWELGIDEYFAAGGLVVIEWADRVAGCLPAERLEIRISVTGPQSRRFDLEALGDRYRPVIEALRAWPQSPAAP